MKNQMLMLSILVLITGSLLTNCQSPASKEDKAKDEVQAAANSMDATLDTMFEVGQDTITAYQAFVKESEVRMDAFEKNIAELKVKIAKENKENKAAYQKNLADLEQKNSEMKRKLKAYKDDGIEGWNKFKTEFSKDLDELGNAFKNFTVNNLK
jgi:septal ring factor EnvC (AmiA/AmiB activator)